MLYLLNPTPSYVLSQLAANFKALRKTKKWSQGEIARRSGVSLGSIKRFEHTGQISLESLLKLAHAMGTLDEFNTLFKQDEQLEKVKNLFTKP